MKRTRRYVLLALLAVTCCFMPLSCVPVLFVWNSVNPMQLMFLTRFTVENQSGEHVSFTPIGTWGEDGNRSRLPVYITRFPAIDALRTGDFPLAPGEVKSIVYDWDDINLSEIAVRTDDGRLYQLVVDPKPTERQYHPAEKDRFVIPPVRDLEGVDPRVLAAVQSEDRNRTLWWVFLGGLIVPLVLWRLVIAYREEREPA